MPQNRNPTWIEIIYKIRYIYNLKISYFYEVGLKTEIPIL